MGSIRNNQNAYRLVSRGDEEMPRLRTDAQIPLGTVLPTRRALGPQVGGALADSTHSVTGALLLGAAAPILVMVVSLVLRETA